MTETPDREQTETVDTAQLEHVTGGGLGSTIGSMFGAEGAKWGGFADNIVGQIGGLLGGGGNG